MVAKTLFQIACVLTWSLSARAAEECREYQLITSENKVVYYSQTEPRPLMLNRTLEPLDQGSTNTCYAQAPAFILDYINTVQNYELGRDVKSMESVSPMALAIHQSSNFGFMDVTDVDFGDPMSILNDYQTLVGRYSTQRSRNASKTCSYGQWPNVTDWDKYKRELTPELKKHLKAYILEQAAKGLTVDDIEKRIFIQKTIDKAKDMGFVIQRPSGFAQESGFSPRLIQLAQSLGIYNYTDISFLENKSNACLKNGAVDLRRVIFHTKTTDSLDVFKETVDSDSFVHYPILFVAKITLLQKNATVGHAMVIVGQRKKDNKCEVLIRNSTGTRGTFYNSFIHSETKIGSLWVDREILREHEPGFTFTFPGAGRKVD